MSLRGRVEWKKQWHGLLSHPGKQENVRDHVHPVLCHADVPKALGKEIHLPGAVTHCVEFLEWPRSVQSLGRAAVPRYRVNLAS